MSSIVLGIPYGSQSFHAASTGATLLEVATAVFSGRRRGDAQRVVGV